MAYLEWEESFSVKVPSIDNQHRILIDLINAIERCMGNQPDKPAMHKVLTAIIQYAKFHFNYEEIMLEKFHYPEIEEHKVSHSNLFEQLKKYEDRLSKGEDDEMSMELLDFLSTWLKTHILFEDMAYSSYLSSSGAV